MNKLFDQFDSVSSKAWKQRIQVDLKGADYNKTLLWSSPDGIDVKPFYHRDQLKGQPLAVPGTPKGWEVVQTVFADDPNICNRLICEALEKGAESIQVLADKPFEIRQVFKDASLAGVGVYFRLAFLNEAFYTKLLTELRGLKAHAYINLDPIGQLAKAGNWFNDLKTDHSVLDALIDQHPESNILGVDMGIYQNAGASMLQQLAYTMAHASEYLNHMGNRTAKMTFTVAVGGNYFFEIAKIRALRILYGTLAKAFGQPQECHIVASPTTRNKTIYDYNMNMLRTTTECMSAVLGGANAVANLAYDAVYHKSNPFGERISRNQLLILKAESYFGQVINPVDGTYYVESITAQLAEKALELFKNIEKAGGLLKGLKDGKIQNKINEQALAEQQRFNNKEKVLVGTNKYPNPDDRMKEQIELFPFLKKTPRKTLIEPILARRLAEGLEKERLNDE